MLLHAAALHAGTSSLAYAGSTTARRLQESTLGSNASTYPHLQACCPFFAAAVVLQHTLSAVLYCCYAAVFLSTAAAATEGGAAAAAALTGVDQR